jgi:hypothetical protein
MISVGFGTVSKRILQIDFVPGDLEALFGATTLSFAEASKGYEGLPYRGIFFLQERMSKYHLSIMLSFVGVSGILIAHSKTFDIDTARFVGWLQRRRRQLAASEASENATGATQVVDAGDMLGMIARI